MSFSMLMLIGVLVCGYLYSVCAAGRVAGLAAHTNIEQMYHMCMVRVLFLDQKQTQVFPFFRMI